MRRRVKMFRASCHSACVHVDGMPKPGARPKDGTIHPCDMDTSRQGYGEPASTLPRWPLPSHTGEQTAREIDVAIDAYLWHMETHHGRKPSTRLSRAFGGGVPVRMWKMPKPKREPFVPERFDVGDTVSWESRGRVHTGQVWSGHPAPRTRWVVDGTSYHAVHESQLVPAGLADRIAS